MKTRFVGLLRGLLQRFDDNEAAEMEQPRPVAMGTPPAPAAASANSPATPPATPKPFAPEPAASASAANPDELELPLSSVLAALPMDLRAKIIQQPPAGASMVIPIQKVLSQLAHGSVKISFGELRLAAPQLFVNSGGEHDSRPVTLPLNEILARLNPTMLARRAVQKRVEVAPEISGPFDGRGQGISFTTAPLKAPAPTPPPAPAPRNTAPIPWPAAASRPVTPLSPRQGGVPHATIPMPSRNSPAPNPVIPMPGATSRNGNGNGIAQNFRAASVPSPAPAPSNGAGQPDFSQPPILAPLAALAESWPEALRREIAQLNLSGAQVALPVNLVEPALKRGRVLFPWRYVRSWIKPNAPTVSVHDNLELELPLKVIAPLFFARNKPAARPQRRVSVATEIPNLFFGFPQPQPATDLVTHEPAPRPATDFHRPALKPVDAKLADTNFYVWGDTTETPRIDETDYKRSPAPATDFSNRRAMPQNVVERAAELPGVAGAIVALQDGLKVASHVPAELNADTLAAFLPQIFDRLGQSTRELRMGSLNNVNFTVGNVPWKIFRVSSVYFAAFGHAGEPLPTGQLAELAAELDRKK